jgi:hypothetical protein
VHNPGVTVTGFSCLWFLSRLWKGGLGIVPVRRTLLHFSPYTFKQISSAEMERMMNVQEVILKVMAGSLKW